MHRFSAVVLILGPVWPVPPGVRDPAVGCCGAIQATSYPAARASTSGELSYRGAGDDYWGATSGVRITRMLFLPPAIMPASSSLLSSGIRSLRNGTYKKPLTSSYHRARSVGVPTNRLSNATQPPQSLRYTSDRTVIRSRALFISCGDLREDELAGDKGSTPAVSSYRNG